MKRYLSALLAILLVVTSIPFSFFPNIALGATEVVINDTFETYDSKAQITSAWGRATNVALVVEEGNKLARVSGSSGDFQIRNENSAPHYQALSTADFSSGKVILSTDIRATTEFNGKILGFKTSTWYQPLELKESTVESMGVPVTSITKAEICDGKWHKIVVALDKTGNKASVYFDGKEIVKNVSYVGSSFTGAQFINSSDGISYDVDNVKVLEYTQGSSVTTSFIVNNSNGDVVSPNNVPISGAYVDVVFSDEFINSSTLNETNIVFSSETTTADAISFIDLGGTVRVILPDLLPDTDYTLSISDDVETVFGQKVTPNTLNLKAADPYIISKFKLNGEDSVGGNTDISINDTYVDIIFFGVEAIPATINADNITVSPTPPGAVTFTAGTNSCKLEFERLAPGTTYTITVTDGVKDIYGKGAAPATFSFTTSISTITASFKLNDKPVGLGNIGIPLTDSYVDIIFSSSDMNEETINEENIFLTPAAPGELIFSLEGDTCRVYFSELAHSTTYTLTMTTGVESMTGEKVTPKTLTFTTVGVEKPGEQDIAAIYLNEEFTNYTGGTPDGWTPSTSSQMTAHIVDAEHGISFRATANAANKDINIRKAFSYPIYGRVVLETKVYPEETANQRALFVLKDSYGGENFLIMMDGGGKIVTMPDETQFASYDANEWYHFQVVVDLEAKKFDVFINGVKKLSDQPLPGTPIENISSIAVKSWNGGSTCYDDIRIYEGTAPMTEEQFDELLTKQGDRLTEEQILSLKLQGAVVLCAGTRNVIVDNVKMKINEETSLMPVVIDEIIYVPANFVLDKFGITKEFVITAGQKNYVYDGVSGSFTYDSIQGAGDVLVPVQEFAEVIGKEIFISNQGLVILSDTENIFNPVKDAFTLKKLYSDITYNAIDTDLVTEEVYAQLREKWAQRSIGDGTHDMNDPDIRLAVEAANEAAMNEWNAMNKSAGRTYLWASHAGTTASADVTTNFNKLKKMAVAYALKEGELYGNEQLRDDIISALEWLNENRYSKNITAYDNWWEWQIGSPQIINDILILMYEDVPTELVDSYMEAIDYHIPKVPEGDAGANLVWRAMVIAVRGIIGKNVDKVIHGRDALVDVFNYTDRGDGFYEDGSFIQHEKHSYTMGYGKSMLGDLTSAMQFFENTLFEISTPSKNNIYDWILNGFEPLMFKGAAMQMASGREISRDYDDHYIGNRVIRSVIVASTFAPENLKPWLQSMAKGWIVEDTARNFFESCPFNVLTEAKKIVEDDSIPVKEPLVLYKQYAAMDEAVMRRDGFAFAVTMSSSRIANFESFSDENLKGWYQNDGVTYIYNELEQYSNDYWPTINPYRLPGITVDTKVKADGEYAGKKPPQDFVGGVEIEKLFGASAMQLDAYNSTLEAKKAWFVFDDEIVALGTDIKSNEIYDVLTVVENRQLNENGDNTLIVNGDTKSSSIGYTENVAAAQWAHLQGNEPGTAIGYFFPEAGNVNFLREQRTGSWYDINKKYGSQDLITKNYLNIWIEHGNKPQNATYAYVLLPNKTPEQTAQYAANPHIEILRNDKFIQAVHETNTNVTEYIFWQSGELGMVKSLNPTAVGVRERDNKLIVSASDPTQKQQKIVIEINKPSLSLESKDQAVTVTETETGFRLEINTFGSIGKTFEAVFSIDGEDENDGGTGNEGTGNEGTGNEGTGNEGTGNEGTGNEGTGNEGTGNEGTGNEGTGNEGTGNGGNDNGNGNNTSEPEEEIGTASTTVDEGQTVTTYSVDESKLETILTQADNNTVITIPVSTNADVVVGELTGKMIKNIGAKKAAVELKTQFATYKLPAEQINIEAISEQLGTTVTLDDIKVKLEIKKPAEEVVRVVEDSAQKGNFTIMVPPVEFKVQLTYADKTEEITSFSAFVERTIAIPDTVDASKITTVVVIEPDGTVRHVPTKLVQIDGKYYAKINSLTNSVYSVVGKTVAFKDVAGHWAQNIINDMGSRMIINGSGNGSYNPENDITRAEFAAIVVRALGIKNTNTAISFNDIKAGDWYAEAVYAAASYNLITGYPDGSFRPNEKISREQAMAIIARAMDLAGLKANMSAYEVNAELSKFTDGNTVSSWARASLAAAIKAGVVSGNNGKITPNKNITRAETAALVQKFLLKAGLI